MAAITILIPTSPIPSHPDTKIIDATITSIRAHLPDSLIIITCDGVSATNEWRRDAYAEYVKTLQSKRAFTGRTKVLTWTDHIHQSGMLLAALSYVDTPLVLYLEHDWQLGLPIEWDELMHILTKREANYIKFYQGQRIHPLHEHMMFQRVITHDIPLIQTVQYSANPHLALTDWYRDLAPFFENHVDYIENLLHGPIANAPWKDYKLMIYNPVNGDMKRSFHLDGAGTR